MQQDLAEAHALRLLTWLSGDEDQIMTFLGATGASLDDLRQGLKDPDFLASVMDFILSDDRLVIDGAGAVGLAPEDLMAVRQALPGGALPNWT